MAMVAASSGTDMESVPVYRNFWRRVGASLVDMVIILPIIFTPYFILKADFVLGIASEVLIYSGIAFYPIWFHARYGATPGKMALGLKLLTDDLGKVGWRHAVRRSIPEILLAYLSCSFLTENLYANRDAVRDMDFALYTAIAGSGGMALYKALSNLWMFSEWMTMLLNRRRRALHDYIGGTVVVRR